MLYYTHEKEVIKMSTMKSFRLSDWGLRNLEDLRIENQGLNYTQIIEYALSLAVLVNDTWNNSYHLIGEGPFELDNDRQALSVSRCIDEMH